jgi:hypothetical protein
MCDEIIQTCVRSMLVFNPQACLGLRLASYRPPSAAAETAYDSRSLNVNDDQIETQHNEADVATLRVQPWNWLAA